MYIYIIDKTNLKYIRIVDVRMSYKGVRINFVEFLDHCEYDNVTCLKKYIESYLFRCILKSGAIVCQKIIKVLKKAHVNANCYYFWLNFFFFFKFIKHFQDITTLNLVHYSLHRKRDNISIKYRSYQKKFKRNCRYVLKVDRVKD